jgi:hypothetical protein
MTRVEDSGTNILLLPGELLYLRSDRIAEVARHQLHVLVTEHHLLKVV